MKIFQITSSEELKIALARFDVIFETSDPEELKELDALATLICDFEDKSLTEEMNETIGREVTSSEINELKLINALKSIPSVGDDFDFERNRGDE